MYSEDAKKQRHHPEKGSGSISQMVALYLRGLSVALKIFRLTPPSADRVVARGSGAPKTNG
jgi:hypothetical protein